MVRGSHCLILFLLFVQLVGWSSFLGWLVWPNIEAATCIPTRYLHTAHIVIFDTLFCIPSIPILTILFTSFFSVCFECAIILTIAPVEVL